MRGPRTFYTFRPLLAPETTLGVGAMCVTRLEMAEPTPSNPSGWVRTPPEPPGARRGGGDGGAPSSLLQFGAFVS